MGEATQTQTRVGFQSIENINKGIHWFDEFLMSISTWLLGVAFILAVSDVGTNGMFFERNWWLLAGWSVAIAIGMESQLRTLVRRAKLAYRARDYGAMVMWALLAVLIFAVSSIALIIFSTEKMLGLTEQQALAATSIDPVWYVRGRAILTGVLVVISGFASYEMSAAKPNTDEVLAQIRHEKALLPEQIELDALRSERARQADELRLKRMGHAAATAKNEVATNLFGKAPKEQPMTLAAASYERIVDADTSSPDDDDDPTPPTPPRGPNGPRNPGKRGRPSTAMVVVPQVIEGMEYARPTGPLGDLRVNAAKEIIAAAPEKMTLAKLAEAINKRVPSEKYLTPSNASKIQTIAYQELAMEKKLPAWAEQFVVRAA